MGKKNRSKPNSKLSKPTVSVCTPTFNRRPFIKSMLACFDSQIYPKNKLEWIIVDDGTDKIEDLVKDHPNVKYFKYDEKLTLGKKRNILHEKSSGEIIVYMDDDDYYPPTRISHAVEVLQQHPKALCAGASELYIWFKHIGKMYQFGPYGPNHATAGTFAFRRELLKQTKYNESACLAEEKEFLKNYTIPFAQLDPKHTILVFSHIHNTFDKKKLLSSAPNKFVKPSDKTVDDFVNKEHIELKKFFMEDIDDILNNYDPGRPEMKPDVIKQTQELHEERMKMQKEMNKNQGKIMMQHPQLGEVALDNNQIVDLLNKLQNEIKQRVEENHAKDEVIKSKNNEISKLNVVIDQLNNEINNIKSLIKTKINEVDDVKVEVVEEH
jgi:glycosyltransferase involved in cell wall biosynthesis